MSKNLMKSIKVLGLCLVLSLFVGVAFVNAQAPQNNVAGPLNVGPSYQMKEGSLRLTNGGFRSAGPGLFDDIVVVGYNPGAVVAPAGQAAQKSTFLQDDQIKKDGFFTKLARFLGLSTEKAVAVESDGAVGGLGTPGPVCSPACGPYQNCLPNGVCVYPACTLDCGSGNCQWGTNGMYCEGVANPGGLSSAGLEELTTTTYKLTVNGNSDLKGYTRVTGGMDVSGTITSGGKNVCLQDGTNCSVSENVLQFGGTYTVGYNNNPACRFANPLTGACSCPAGFTSYDMAEYTLITNTSVNPVGNLLTGSPSNPSTTAHNLGVSILDSSRSILKGCYKASGGTAGLGKG